MVFRWCRCAKKLVGCRERGPPGHDRVIGQNLFWIFFFFIVEVVSYACYSAMSDDEAGGAQCSEADLARKAIKELQAQVQRIKKSVPKVRVTLCVCMHACAISSCNTAHTCILHCSLTIPLFYSASVCSCLRLWCNQGDKKRAKAAKTEISAVEEQIAQHRLALLSLSQETTSDANAPAGGDDGTSAPEAVHEGEQAGDADSKSRAQKRREKKVVSLSLMACSVHRLSNSALCRSVSSKSERQEYVKRLRLKDRPSASWRSTQRVSVGVCLVLHTC